MLLLNVMVKKKENLLTETNTIPGWICLVSFCLCLKFAEWGWRRRECVCVKFPVLFLSELILCLTERTVAWSGRVYYSYSTVSGVSVDADAAERNSIYTPAWLCLSLPFPCSSCGDLMRHLFPSFHCDFDGIDTRFNGSTGCQWGWKDRSPIPDWMEVQSNPRAFWFGESVFSSQIFFPGHVVQVPQSVPGFDIQMTSKKEEWCDQFENSYIVLRFWDLTCTSCFFPGKSF